MTIKLLDPAEIAAPSNEGIANTTTTAQKSNKNP
jgi:hypothetical protein